MTYAFPTIQAAVKWSGGLVRLNRDQVWPADDPFVQARPDLFASQPRELHRSAPPEDTEQGAPPEDAEQPKVDDVDKPPVKRPRRQGSA